jgi:hypothetical protein
VNKNKPVGRFFFLQPAEGVVDLFEREGLHLWENQGVRVFYVKRPEGESVSNFTLPLEPKIIVWENMRTQSFTQVL